METIVEHVQSLDVIERIRTDWDALHGRHPQAHLSQSFDYAAVAIRFARTRGGGAHLITTRQDGVLVGAWVVATHREGLLRIAQPPGDGSYEEYAYPLVDPAAGEPAMRAILLAALTVPCDILRIYNARPDTGISELLERPPFSSRTGQRVRVRTYALDFGLYGGWDGYLAAMPSQRMNDLKRKTRKLEALGQVELGWCATAESAADAVRWVFERKREWLSRKGLFSLWLGEDHTRDFYIALARRLDLTDLPLVTTLRVNGELLAAQINLPGRELFESMIVAHDDAYSKCSPGEVLTHYGLQLAAERGLQYDYRLVTSPYKERRANVVFQVETSDMAASTLGRQLGPAQAQAEHLAQRTGRFLSKLRQPTGPATPEAAPSAPAGPAERPARSPARRYVREHR